ncbi:MAG: hypothetical protein GXP05_09745 [Alphaproteobacteria bacterium]|nr:hypothetical protein [Alphaproteobacteria bacterium]
MEPDALRGAMSIKCTRCKSFNQLRPPPSPLSKRPERDEKDHTRDQDLVNNPSATPATRRTRPPGE